MTIASQAGKAGAWLDRSRFSILLVSLLVVPVLQPLLRQMLGELWILDVLLALVLLGGVAVVSRRRRLLLVALLIAVPALALHGSTYVAQSRLALTLMLCSYLAFATFVAGVVISFVAHSRRVTTDTILGSACGYLLVGLGFALLATLIEWLDPNAYAIPGAGPGVAGLVSEFQHEFRSLVYFSFVTLTTLGYGDIQPLSGLARGLAVVEAVLGQLYVAVVIAFLVGVRISQRDSP